MKNSFLILPIYSALSFYFQCLNYRWLISFDFSGWQALNEFLNFFCESLFRLSFFYDEILKQDTDFCVNNVRLLLMFTITNFT